MTRDAINMMVVALTCALTTLGCAATNQQNANSPDGADTSAAPLTDDVSAMTVRLLPAAGSDAVQQLHAQLGPGLSAAGYTLTTDDAATADLEVKLSMTMTEKPTMMVTVVNGVQQVTYNVVATLTVSGGGKVIDTVSYAFESKNGIIPGGASDALVARMTQSDKVTLFARQRSEQGKAAAVAAEQQEQEGLRRRDDEAWLAANATACKSPAALDSCKAVQQYLVDFPSGRHASEAQAVLAEARPRLDALQKDENYWTSSAQWQRCEQDARRDACEGVELYIANFPAGLHASEAHELLKTAGME